MNKVVFALMLLFLCSVSFAQKRKALPLPPPVVKEALPELEPESAQAEPEPPPPPPKPVFAPVELPPPPADGASIASYEAFLSSIKASLNSMQPQRDSLETAKKAINAQTPAPKDEYESSEAYTKRIADFEKNRQAKIDTLEAAFSAKNKPVVDKLKAEITSKKDYQPNWGNILKKDTTVEGYLQRIELLKHKISGMNVKVGEIAKELAKLDLGKDSENAHWSFDAKNALYMRRLELAQALMKDYIIQEQTRVLTTPKHKPEMTLGAYNPDREEFEFAMKNSGSAEVPFDYSGSIKISANQAREMNRQTTDLSAAIDYINYPFISSGAKFYPGVKSPPHIFYKDQEIPVVSGSFRSVAELIEMPGYINWAIYADSLLSVPPKLVPQGLDSAYAMCNSVSCSVELPPPPPPPPVSISKIILRVAPMALAAAGAGFGFTYNNNVFNKGEKAKSLHEETVKYAKSYDEANPDNKGGYINDPNYDKKYRDYKESLDELDKEKKKRTISYSATGAAIVAGIFAWYLTVDF